VVYGRFSRRDKRYLQDTAHSSDDVVSVATIIATDIGNWRNKLMNIAARP
jgi:hypothetical protein